MITVFVMLTCSACGGTQTGNKDTEHTRGKQNTRDDRADARDHAHTDKHSDHVRDQSARALDQLNHVRPCSLHGKNEFVKEFGVVIVGKVGL